MNMSVFGLVVAATGFLIAVMDTLIPGGLPPSVQLSGAGTIIWLDANGWWFSQ